jgi:toxin ParE1/3/4
LIGRIIRAVESLSHFPRLGRVVPEVKRQEIREIIYSHYRIIYRLDKEILYILAIIHATRDIKRVKPNPWDVV